MDRPPDDPKRAVGDAGPYKTKNLSGWRGFFLIKIESILTYRCVIAVSLIAVGFCSVNSFFVCKAFELKLMNKTFFRKSHHIKIRFCFFYCLFFPICTAMLNSESGIFC